MNRRVRLLGLGLAVCFVALFAQLNVIQVFRADEILASPDNTRPIVEAFSRNRGTIRTADGVVVAESIPVAGRFNYLRRYPQAELYAQTSGFFSFIYGVEGVERSYNGYLTGADLAPESIVDLFNRRDRVGDVVLSLRSGVQQTAREALGEQPGSVVALDPRSGEVLALWSYPSYDPNFLSSHDLELVRLSWDLLLADEANPLLPRAYRERYFPGSTFKVVTASAGLVSGTVTPTDPSFPVTDEYVPPLTTRPIRNFGGTSCGGTLFRVLAISCNTAFAEMGVQIGPESMVSTSTSFGFNQRPPIDLPAAAVSMFPPVEFFDENTPALAQAAIGQNDVQATPLQMALVAAGVANGGEVMAPVVVREVRDDRGRVVERHEPTVWQRAVPADVAETMTAAMVGVVEDGTAGRMAIPGVAVAAKTGTAQVGTDPPRAHLWMIAFAPAQDPQVAVAVILENRPEGSDETGGRLAAPVARAVIEAALGLTPS